MIQVVEAPRAVEREFRLGTNAQAYLNGVVARRVAAVEEDPQATESFGRLEVPGYGDMTEAVMAVLWRREQAKQRHIRQECAQMAKAGGERRHVTDRDGGGEVTMQIHPASFHYWGRRLGYECWDDAQFCREYLRDNEYARVKSRSKKIQVGARAAVDYCLRKGKVLRGE